MDEDQKQLEEVVRSTKTLNGSAASGRTSGVYARARR